MLTIDALEFEPRHDEKLRLDVEVAAVKGPRPADRKNARATVAGPGWRAWGGDFVVRIPGEKPRVFVLGPSEARDRIKPREG